METRNRHKYRCGQVPLQTRVCPSLQSARPNGSVGVVRDQIEWGDLHRRNDFQPTHCKGESLPSVEMVPKRNHVAQFQRAYSCSHQERDERTSSSRHVLGCHSKTDRDYLFNGGAREAKRIPHAQSGFHGDNHPVRALSKTEPHHAEICDRPRHKSVHFSAQTFSVKSIPEHDPQVLKGASAETGRVGSGNTSKRQVRFTQSNGDAKKPDVL